LTQAGEPREEPARRAQSPDPGSSAAPKRAADAYEPEQLSFQRFDDPEAFIETRIIPRIVWDSEFDPSAPAARKQQAEEPEPDRLDRAVPATRAPDDSAESLVDAIDEADRKNLGRNSLLMAS